MKHNNTPGVSLPAAPLVSEPAQQPPMTCSHSNRSYCAMFDTSPPMLPPVGTPEWVKLSDEIEASPPCGGDAPAPQADKLRKLETRHANLLMDLHRLANWEKPLCYFAEVAAIAEMFDAALSHAQRVAPISDGVIDAKAINRIQSDERREVDALRKEVAEAVHPSPAPQAEAAVPEGLRGRVITALECGALWAKGSEGGPRIEAVLAELLAAAPQQPAAPAAPAEGVRMLTAAEQAAQKWHELKTDPGVFDAVASGVKTHEIRRNDRDFKVGDGLLLRRTKFTGAQMHMRPESCPLEYTGEECRRVVSHVLDGYGLQDGWVILSFAAAPVVAPAESAALLHAQRVAPISDERIEKLAIDNGFGFFGQWLLYQGGRNDLLRFSRALLAEAVHPSPAPKPDGYAYEYPGPYGGILFTHGEERNGSKPLRAIPYWLGAAPKDGVRVDDAPRFQKTYCSQCGGEFGPGNEGFSHCIDHGKQAMRNGHL